MTSDLTRSMNTQTCPNCLGRPWLASEWPLTSQVALSQSLTSFWEVWIIVADLYIDLLQLKQKTHKPAQTAWAGLGWPQNNLWPHKKHDLQVWPHSERFDLTQLTSMSIYYSRSRKHTNLPKLPGQAWVGLRMTSDLTSSVTSKFDLILRGLTLNSYIDILDYLPRLT